jgi:hypothetical protein
MAIAVFVGALALNVSKFSGQVLLFLSLLMAFLLSSATLLVYPILCIIMALLLSGGHYLRVLQGQISHLWLYATTLVHHNVTTRARKDWLRLTKLDIWKALISGRYESVYAILLIKFGVLIFALALIAAKGISGDMGNYDTFLVAWLVSAFLLFLVTATPTFLFLGEADRYLEYALIPGFLLFASFLGPDFRGYILVAFAVVHLAIYVLNVRLFIREQRIFEVEQLSELMDHLKTVEPGVILSLLGKAPFEIAYRTDGSGHRVCWSESISRAHISEEEYDRFFWRYPFPRPDFKYFTDKYGVGLIAVFKRAVGACRKQGCAYDFKGLEIVFENEGYALYKVPEKTEPI